MIIKNLSKEETGSEGDHGYDGVTDAADDPAVCEEGEQTTCSSGEDREGL